MSTTSALNSRASRSMGSSRRSHTHSPSAGCPRSPVRPDIFPRKLLILHTVHHIVDPPVRLAGRVDCELALLHAVMIQAHDLGPRPRDHKAERLGGAHGDRDHHLLQPLRRLGGDMLTRVIGVYQIPAAANLHHARHKAADEVDSRLRVRTLKTASKTMLNSNDFSPFSVQNRSQSIGHRLPSHVP